MRGVKTEDSHTYGYLKTKMYLSVGMFAFEGTLKGMFKTAGRKENWGTK